ncbi:MAG: cation:proton antiporter, partial [Alistipes sp.]
ATFAAQRGAHNIAIDGSRHDEEHTPIEEHILLPVSNERTVNELVSLSTALKADKDHNLYALHAVDNKVNDANVQKRARKILDAAATAAAATDTYMHTLLRYDVNNINAIVSVVREQHITDLVMAIYQERADVTPIPGKTILEVVSQSDVTTFAYHSAQPLATIKRHIVFVPRNAEKEAGFQLWLRRIRNIAHNTGAKIRFNASEATIPYLQAGKGKRAQWAEFVVWDDWEELPERLKKTKKNDCIWVVMSRRDRISYNAAMSRIPAQMEQYLATNSFILLFPVQAGDTEKRYFA